MKQIEDTNFANDFLHAFCLIPFSGFETVSTCLYWSFLYLIHYPEIQARIQEEIGNMKSIILTIVIFIIKFL